MNLPANIDDRACRAAAYIIENNATVRAAAAELNISKSTVHKDITERLECRNPLLYRQVKAVLERNKAERHIRGGEATKQKYKSGGVKLQRP